MIVVLAALGLLLAGGLGALAAGRRSALASAIAVGTGAGGCALGFVATLSVPFAGAVPSLRHGWDVPYGEIHLEIDALSSFFLMLIFSLSPLVAVFGARYLQPHGRHRSLGPVWFFFNLLVACMAMVVIARDGVLFLVAWEVMSLCAYFLVTFEDDEEHVRDAGWVMLVATHVGTAFLLVMFVLLARQSGSMDFDRWKEVGGLSPVGAGILFTLAVIGFGTKAGLVPFHVWLPEAHPAAPSHVSAMMSGLMIKTGIYGLLRALMFLGQPPAWWGMALIAIGVVSGVLGVVFALEQQDLKRLLAFSSIENIGIIVLGLGVGLLGVSWGSPAMAALGYAGSLLHVMNHAVFKGLLFLGVGAVIHETGTRHVDRLGGLLKRMPISGTAILIGSAALIGLPPFNGFIGEFLISMGGFAGVISLQGARALSPLAALVGMALISGLVAVCFLRFFGTAFLGSPRSEAVSVAAEPSPAMRWPMVILALLCILLGLAPALGLVLVTPVVTYLAGSEDAIQQQLGLARMITTRVSLMSMILLVAIGLLAAFRRALLSRRAVRVSSTWACGYDRLTSRMQYTASSFAQPIAQMFELVPPGRRVVVPPEGYFPGSASLRSEVARPFQERLYRPAFRAVSRQMSRLRWLHHGRVQLYTLYIVLTLITMLAWFLI